MKKWHPQWANRGTSVATVGLALHFCFAALPAQSQTPTTTAPAPAARPADANASEPLRIAIRLIKPDVFEDNGKLVGFSVDFGKGILKQLQKREVLQTYSDVPEILNAVRSGEADLGIAAIAITSQREQAFDFSHPILTSSLQIMVLVPADQSRPIEQEILRRLSEPNLLRLFCIVALLTLIPAHIVWYSERRKAGEVVSNPAYIPGIFQAIWWTVLTLLGQSDEMPAGPIGKIVGLFWVVVGIIFVAYFTANITTELTVQQLEGSIHELSDLENRPVAVVSTREAIDYLQERNIQQAESYEQFEPAYEALLDGEVDAVIASAPLLNYYATHVGQGKVQVVGTPFLNQFYAIVMPKDSPYRKPINRAILVLQENGTYEQIYQKWFGDLP